MRSGLDQHCRSVPKSVGSRAPNGETSLELEELHLEPGPEPVYLYADSFVGLSTSAAGEAFAILCRYPGDSPLFLVSADGEMEGQICDVEDSSDLHAELKQALGAQSIGYARPARVPENAEVSRASA